MSRGDRPAAWLVFGNAPEWRDWLERNHRTATEVWLRIRKVRSREPGVTLEAALDEAVCFGWIDSRMFSQDTDGFLLRFSPRRPDSPWSLRNRHRAERMEKEGRMAEAGAESVRAARVFGTWDAAYTSLVPPEVPGDLASALADDPEAAAGFDRWPNSLQLQYVHWIGQARTPATRDRRIAATVDQARRDASDAGTPETGSGSGTHPVQ